MRRIYKDWTIQTTAINDDFGKGIKATFYIAKLNGTKAQVQVYVSYGAKNHLRVIESVERIIDTL